MGTSSLPRRAILDSVPASTSDPLLLEIQRDPERPEPYLVYADWLQEHGDPRGKLIALHHALGARRIRHRIRTVVASSSHRGEPFWWRNESEVDLHDAADWLLSDHYDYFLDSFGDRFDLDWFMGFIRRAELKLPWGGGGIREENVAALLDRLLTHDSARFVRELIAGPFPGPRKPRYQKLIDTIARLAPPTLRSLRMGQPPRNVGANQILGDASALLGIADLQELSIQGLGSVLHPAAPARLTRLELIVGDLHLGGAHDLAAAPWPELEQLELWVGTPEHGAMTTTDDLLACLTRDVFPKLRTLIVRVCPFGAELCQRITELDVLPQLRQLALTHSPIDDRAASHLARHGEHLRHLEWLDLRDNFLSGILDEDLQSVAAEVRLENQLSGEPAAWIP